ncbi:hypothetical protein LH417_11600 [Laribacter hongkongensis]|uniref:hypothetical protein n=2 Tax=Laribacter hongkongensis TaxID=168471 RepID=UPI001EFD6228|nr:hypothetical protein [Laribacter hongkongensis]MCG9023565.1 hypothetical protein [Laribacter hongkongensis]
MNSGMNREERDQAITDIVQTIGGFIRRDFDHLTAKRYWDHVIASTPPDILTEALIRALCSGAYQERCHPPCRAVAANTPEIVIRIVNDAPHSRVSVGPATTPPQRA